MRKIIVASVVFALGPDIAHGQQKVEQNLNGRPAGFARQARGLLLPERDRPAAPIESSVVKGQPFSAEVLAGNIQTLADGNRIVQRMTGRVYRDNEGRVRREEDRAPGSPRISISDSVSGLFYSLDAANRVARQAWTPSYGFTQAITELGGSPRATLNAEEAGRVSARSKIPVPQPPPPPSPQGLRAGGRRGRGAEEQVAENLPDRLIEGVLASGIRRTTTIARGTIGNDRLIRIVSEEWRSPELRALVMTNHNDPRTGHSTYRLFNIRRRAQDPGLFQVPADYTIQVSGGGAAGATPKGAVGGPGRGR